MSKQDMINEIYNIRGDWIYLLYLTSLSYEEVKFEYDLIIEGES